MVRGIGASSGIAMGRAFVIPTWEWDFPEKLIDVADLAHEFERLYDGIRHSKNEIEQIKQEFVSVLGEEQTQIFDAHLAILEDPVFMNEVQGIMQRQYKAAEVAVKETIEKFVGMFDLLDDGYMKERALDIKDVGNRLLKHLLGALEETLPPKDEPYVLVAKELIPSQMVHLDVNQTLGLVTMMGGKTSHVAIMARAMGVPYVLGVEGKLQTPIQTGDFLIIDGDEGLVFVNPSEQEIDRYRQLRETWKAQQELLLQLADIPSQTEDGLTINLAANISSIKELEQAMAKGASGVGLFRTEFLYMNRTSFPEEQEQFEVYREVAERLNGKPLVIRTLDVGGDKHLDYLELPEANVPFRKDVQVGIMIELPAAVMISDLLAKEVDFFSIGTNDLVQYVLAVDRMNEQVAHLYDPFHPSVLRMLKMTVDHAKRFGTHVSVCGEMAGDVRALPIWIALGISELSMSVSSILQVKNSLIQSRHSDAAAIWQELAACPNSSSVLQVLGRYWETELAAASKDPQTSESGNSQSASGCR